MIYEPGGSWWLAPRSPGSSTAQAQASHHHPATGPPRTSRRGLLGMMERGPLLVFTAQQGDGKPWLVMPSLGMVALKVS